MTLRLRQSDRAKPQFVNENIRRPLANRQSSVVSVGRYIPRHNAEIGNLQTLNSIDTEAAIHHTVLVTRKHLAGAQSVPGCADVTAQPLLKHSIVIRRILDIRRVSRKGFIKLDTCSLRSGSKRRVALCHFATIGWHAPDNLTLLFI